MSCCCESDRCTCRVVAGSGVTVDGNGGSAAPYVISADLPEPTALEAGDTPTIDTTVTGTGTPDDPFEVSATVILDPSPPGGGDQLIQSGPDGLYLECEQVRGCISAGDGTSYDPTTGVVQARVSTDTGNQVVFGADGGLYAPAAAGTSLTAVDSTSVDVEVTGTGTVGDPYEVTASVILDPTPPAGGTNLIQSGPEGLYLECEQVRGCISAGDGATYDPDTGVIEARISADAGNTVAFGTDGGLYAAGGGTSAPTDVEGGTTWTATNTVTGTGTPADPFIVSTDVTLDPTPPAGGTNLIQTGPEGLYLECEQVRSCITAGDGASYSAVTGEVEARLSTQAGNQVAFGPDGGLFVPPDAPLEIGCGLQGEGTAASPLAAFPIAGSLPWADNWACDDTDHSTLKCDPDTGALWTPPEHFSATDHFMINHMNPAIAAIGPTSGWTILQPGGTPAFVQWDIPANFLGNACRFWGYETDTHASVDITANSTATFELGYVLAIDGVVDSIRPIEGVYTAYGASRRERYAGTVSHGFFSLPPAQARLVVYYPAVNVLTGSIAVNAWNSDAMLHTQTRA
ncbi:hypothetical protein [Streptomyces cinereoruber]|uniref:hypothetical protein n=1 Tax=Streptomyces cinereoruber TaxID=67260 RepID=UPI00363C400B